MNSKWNGDFNEIPETSGIWAIFDDNGKFSSQMYLLYLCDIDDHIQNVQLEKKALYLGFSRNLRSGILSEMNMEGDSSFLRTLGAVLGILPEFGQLAGSDNNNYTYSKRELELLKSFVRANFKLVWLEIECEHLELKLLRKCRPVLNLLGNPFPCGTVNKYVELSEKIAHGKTGYECYSNPKILRVELTDIDRLVFSAEINFEKKLYSYVLYDRECIDLPLKTFQETRMKAITAEQKFFKWKEDYDYLTMDSKNWSMELSAEGNFIYSYGSKNHPKIKDKVYALTSIAFITTESFFYW